MTPQLARVILTFLERVDLKGGEAPAFMQAVAALNELLPKPPEVSVPQEVVSE